MSFFEEIKKKYDFKNLGDGKLMICGYSFKRDIFGISKKHNFFKNWVVSLNKKRALMIETKMNLNKFCTLKHQKLLDDDKHVSSIISPKKDGISYQIKIIGEPCLSKSQFMLQILHEELVEGTREDGSPCYLHIKYTDVKVLNIVMKWNIELSKIRDFDTVNRELKDLCKFYDTKFPPLILSNGKYTCNLSHNGIATSAGLKEIGDIQKLREFVESILQLMDKNATEENIFIGQDFDHRFELYKLDEIQTYNCFNVDENSCLLKYFNISDIKLEKKRYLYVITTPNIIKQGTYKSLDFFFQKTKNFVRKYGFSPELDFVLNI